LRCLQELEQVRTQLAQSSLTTEQQHHNADRTSKIATQIERAALQGASDASDDMVQFFAGRGLDEEHQGMMTLRNALEAAANRKGQPLRTDITVEELKVALQEVERERERADRASLEAMEAAEVASEAFLRLSMSKEDTENELKAKLDALESLGADPRKVEEATQFRAEAAAARSALREQEAALAAARLERVKCSNQLLLVAAQKTQANEDIVSKGAIAHRTNERVAAENLVNAAEKEAEVVRVWVKEARIRERERAVQVAEEEEKDLAKLRKVRMEVEEAERAAREKVDRVSKGRVDREVELQANLQVRPTLFLSPTSCVLSACVSSSF